MSHDLHVILDLEGGADFQGITPASVHDARFSALGLSTVCLRPCVSQSAVITQQACENALVTYRSISQIDEYENLYSLSLLVVLRCSFNQEVISSVAYSWPTDERQITHRVCSSEMRVDDYAAVVDVDSQG